MIFGENQVSIEFACLIEVLVHLIEILVRFEQLNRKSIGPKMHSNFDLNADDNTS